MSNIGSFLSRIGLKSPKKHVFGKAEPRKSDKKPLTGPFADVVVEVSVFGLVVVVVIGFG